MEHIKNKRFDKERALYESCDVFLTDCAFQGEADGESALKESRNIVAKNCLFDLRYPFWHDSNVEISDCEMTEKCRAPLWYTNEIKISNTKLHGTKALRECCHIEIKDSHIISSELGWDSCLFKISNTYAEGEYMLSRARHIEARDFKMKGKYSFQYIEDAVFENCVLDTKDAFWHAKNVTVKNSTVKGEYLGWYSENLTLENCVITGTQPLCYCKNLRLINCQMYECDLAFEKSIVEAEITTPVISIKNVLRGKITIPRVDEIICDSEKYKGVIEMQNAECRMQN